MIRRDTRVDAAVYRGDDEVEVRQWARDQAAMKPFLIFTVDNDAEGWKVLVSYRYGRAT